MNPKTPTIKVWKLRTADNKFSKFIRERDGKCVRCHRQDGLQNSHFWSRVHWATRYDLDNCDALCYACHYGNSKSWEYEQAGEYRDFKLKQLGDKKYKALEKKHKQFIKRRDAILEIMKFFKKEQE